MLAENFVVFHHEVCLFCIYRYIDSLLGDVIRTYLTAHVLMPGGLLATYPDFLAVGYNIIIVIVVALGVKLSSRTNIFFATLNFIICGFIIGTALF